MALPTFKIKCKKLLFFFGICPPPELLPVLGPCEWYMTPTRDAALLISSRAGTDLGLLSDSGVLMLLEVERRRFEADERHPKDTPKSGKT